MKRFRSHSDRLSDDDRWWVPKRSKAYLRESELPVNLYLVLLFLAWLFCGLIWTLFG